MARLDARWNNFSERGQAWDHFWQDAAPTGGATNYTLTCSVGSYAVSGQAATLILTRALSCSAGSYAVSGQVATLTYARALICSPGAYAVTGQDAALTYTPGSGAVNYSLVCANGAYSVSGQVALFNIGHRLACEAGGYAYVGQSATLSYISNGQLGGGAVARNLKRVAEHNRLIAKKLEEEAETRTKLTLKRIVEAAPKPSNGLKKAYRDVGKAQKELRGAEQRLVAFLELQELEISRAEEEFIVQIMAELL